MEAVHCNSRQILTEKSDGSLSEKILETRTETMEEMLEDQDQDQVQVCFRMGQQQDNEEMLMMHPIRRNTR